MPLTTSIVSTTRLRSVLAAIISACVIGVPPSAGSSSAICCELSSKKWKKRCAVPGAGRMVSTLEARMALSVRTAWRGATISMISG